MAYQRVACRARCAAAFDALRRHAAVERQPAQLQPFLPRFLHQHSVWLCALGARQRFARAHTCRLAREAGRKESGRHFVKITQNNPPSPGLLSP